MIDKFITNIEKYKRQLYFVILIIVIMLIIIHIIDITSFCYLYNYNWDIGNVFKKICKNEFFEAETHRFKIADARDLIEITREDEVKYVGVAMCVTIIITFILCCIFAVMVWNIFAVQAYLYVKTINKTNWRWWVVGFWIFIWGIICLGIASWVFLYVGLLFGGVRDISMFNTDSYIQSTYIPILVIIILARLFYYGIQIAVNAEWLSTNLYGVLGLIQNAENLGLSNTFGGLVIFLAFVAFLLCVIYILGSLIRIFRNVQDWDTFYNYDIRLSGTRENVWSQFIKNVLGFEEIQQFENYIFFIRKLSGIYATIFIIAIIMTALFLVLKYFLPPTEEDGKFLKYAILLPIAILFVVLLVCSIITEYDNVINKYILSDPVIYYKQHLNEANKDFNKIVQFEHQTLQNFRPGYICRNYGNAILNVLFSSIFAGVEAIDRDGNTTTNNKYLIDVTPEYIYEEKCDGTKPFAFDNKKKYKEYSIDYYLNGKKFNKNIFYKFNKCTDTNNEVLLKVSTNLYNLQKDWETSRKATIKNNIISAIKNVDKDKVFYDSEKKIKNITDSSTVEKLLSFTENNKLNDVTTITTTIADPEIDKYDDFISNKILNDYGTMLTNFEVLYKDKIDSTFATPPDILKFKADEKSKRYATGLSKIIKTLFDNVNTNLSTSTYELKYAQITPYIISNYNNIIEVDDDEVSSKVFQKTTFDVCKKPSSNNDEALTAATALKDHITKLQNSYEEIKEVYNKLINDNDTQPYTTKKDTITQAISEFKLNFSTFLQDNKAALKDLLESTDANYKLILSRDKPEVNGLDTDTAKTVENVLHNTISRIQELINTYIPKYVELWGQSSLEKLTTEKTRINENIKVIDSNIAILLSDINAVLNKSNSFEKPICTDDKQIAQNMIDNARDANTAIYLLLVLYIIAILSTNLIIL
jgi:hypothetical protein